LTCKYKGENTGNSKENGGTFMIFLCYPKCNTCRKAKKWLEANNITFEERHIQENNPTIQELKDWHKKSGLPLKSFFNTSGRLYKEMKLKEKLPAMSEGEQYSLLASDGMLVKRPILIDDGFVLIGFKETDWKAALGIE
jgi:arsenate reductase